MKKITLSGAAVGCFLAVASNCAAFKHDAPPSSPQLNSQDNVFIGHYGEVIRLNEQWTAEPEMQDLVEVVRFHARYAETQVLGKSSWEPYEPKPGDYASERFTPMHLAQLFVIPKDAPDGFRSLRSLRTAKEKELAASGIGFTIRPPNYGDQNWPQDTFGVLISTPYQVFQLYTQSDRNFFILTAGVFDSANPTNGDFRVGFDSLQEYLKPFQRQVFDDYRVYRNPRVAIPWLLIIGVAGAFALFPRRFGWQGRMRLIGRATLVLSTVLPVLGLSFIYFSFRHGFDRWVNVASVAFVIAAILPFLCAAFSVRQGERQPVRILLWMAGTNLLPALVGLAGSLAYYQGREIIGGGEFFAAAIFLTVLGLMNGVCFGLTFVRGDGSSASGALTPQVSGFLFGRAKP